MDNTKIDFTRYRRPVEIDEFERQLTSTLHIRGQDEIERHPTFFRRQQEQEGRSNWSGGVWGGPWGPFGVKQAALPHTPEARQLQKRLLLGPSLNDI